MALSFLSFLAILPILVVAVMLVYFRIPARTTMPVGFLLTGVVAFYGWGFSFTTLIASSIQGLFITFDILYIIFGAILLLTLLNVGWPDRLDMKKNIMKSPGKSVNKYCFLQ